MARDDRQSAREAFLAWERLRILYNASVSVSFLAVGYPQLREPGAGKLFVVLVASLNIAFCAGLCAEGYLAWAGMDRRAARLLLFILGTLLACFLTAVALIERELHPEAPNLAPRRAPAAA